MISEKKHHNAEDLTIEERNFEIDLLEKERMRVVLRIEELMREYVKESGAHRFTARKYKLGKSPNDFNYKK